MISPNPVPEDWTGNSFDCHNKCYLEHEVKHYKQDCIPVGCVPPRVDSISQHALHWGGLPARGVSLPGGSPCQGSPCQGGLPTTGGILLARGVYQHALRQTPPVNRITHARENITLPQLRSGR